MKRTHDSRGSKDAVKERADVKGWPAFSSRPAVRPFTLLQPPPAAWAADLPASSAFLLRPSQGRDKSV